MNKLRLFLLGSVAAVTLVTGLGLVHPHKAAALSGSSFQAGRIIDDNVFFNGDGMDIPTIQGFLNSKVPSCDTNGTQPSGHSGYSTRAAWGAANGAPAPYTCLKDVMVDYYGSSGDQYCKAIAYGRYSAAGILYTVAKACGVSPQVLLVVLQKEQGLVTDDWPWPNQYTAATGYGCPDTASCDASYSGLFNQIYYGARQYKIYAAKPTLFNFQRNANRTISYSPNSSCGGSSVFLQNQATAGLYNYTPYQPNAAALNNLYGTGDGCSAYGNRNFWRLYNDWFGNTFGIPYSASFMGESGVAATVTNGSPATIWFDFQNTGSQFWKDSTSAPSYYPVTRLMATWPVNRPSNFYDPATWTSASRPVSVFSKVFESDGVTLAADQHTVFPGQIARFQFAMKYPASGMAGGTYIENFELVEDGIPNFWVNGSTAWQAITVPDQFQAAFAGESGEASVSPGHKGTLSYSFKNTGSQFWKDDASALPYYPRTRLMGSWPINRSSMFYDSSSWLGSNRPVSVFTHVYAADGTTLTPDQHTVWPGEIGVFQFPLAYPTTTTPTGKYREDFEMVEDGIPNFWVNGSSAWQNVNVTNP
ncbi:MAG: hypothetical protein JWN38_715 [Candidatus Saccharibacteria bacterium]|nr:hypothetical protein [Candidatus Saccharibacteria bacterium]